jgi:hypothetical protein
VHGQLGRVSRNSPYCATVGCRIVCNVVTGVTAYLRNSFSVLKLCGTASLRPCQTCSATLHLFAYQISRAANPVAKRGANSTVLHLPRCSLSGSTKYLGYAFTGNRVAQFSHFGWSAGILVLHVRCYTTSANVTLMRRGRSACLIGKIESRSQKPKYYGNMKFRFL